MTYTKESLKAGMIFRVKGSNGKGYTIVDPGTPEGFVDFNSLELGILYRNQDPYTIAYLLNKLNSGDWYIAEPEQIKNPSYDIY
jgi:hypothetical protein